MKPYDPSIFIPGAFYDEVYLRSPNHGLLFFWFLLLHLCAWMLLVVIIAAIWERRK